MKKGQYFPFIHDSAAESRVARTEIRRAIDEVRVSSEQERSVAREARERSPETPWVVPRFAFVDATSRVDGNIIVPVRGWVPLAFFGWFRELKSRLEDQWEMLARCQFEEAE